MAKQRGESKQGLIITLVFFILMTIGLGVATYYGFAGQEALEKAAKEAQGKEKTFKDERDWYRFQANYLKAAVGQGQGVDVQELALDEEGFRKGAKWDKQVGAKEMGNVIAALDSRLTPTKQPNLDALLTQEKKRSEELTKQAQGFQVALAGAEKKAKDLETQLKEAQTNYDQALTKLTATAAKDLTNDRGTIDTLRNEIARLGSEKEAAVKKADETLKKVEADSKKKDKTIKDQQALIAQRNDEIASFKQKGSDAPQDWRTDWQIVRLDNRVNVVYINLGSADHVKPQLTFSVHGLGRDGKPLPQAKATLEVVNVLGDHLSQARITSVKDASRDPVVAGDVLFNPSWNPNVKKHVAIAGLIDLTGDGRDSLPEFMRNLERQNIVIDAWLDPKDLTVKGKGITVKTDYLIVGEGLEFNPEGINRDKERGMKLEKAIQEMKDKAAQNGVATTSLSKYLEMIGYRLPRSTSDKPANYAR